MIRWGDCVSLVSWEERLGFPNKTGHCWENHSLFNHQLHLTQITELKCKNSSRKQADCACYRVLRLKANNILVSLLTQRLHPAASKPIMDNVCTQSVGFSFGWNQSSGHFWTSCWLFKHWRTGEGISFSAFSVYLHPPRCFSISAKMSDHIFHKTVNLLSCPALDCGDKHTLLTLLKFILVFLLRLTYILLPLSMDRSRLFCSWSKRPTALG